MDPGGAYSSAITNDNFGNIYIVGGFNDTSVSFGPVRLTRPYPNSVHNLDMFLIQYSSADVATWGKTIGSPLSTTGGVNSVSGYSVTTYCNQVWVDAGYTDKAVIVNRDTISLVPGPDPLLIAGFNTSGNLIGFSSLPTGGDDEAELAADPNGNLFLCGDYFSADSASAHSMVIGTDTFKSYYGGYYYFGSSQELFFMAKYRNISPDTSYAHVDTTVCSDSAITLTTQDGYPTYLWNNGATTKSISIRTSGSYYVIGSGCGMHVDTFNVLFSLPDTIYQQETKAICSTGDSVILKGPTGYSQYVWSTGDSLAQILVKTQGTYIVKASSACGMLIDTFHVIFGLSPTVVLGNDTIFCIGRPITLSSIQPAGTKYLWSTGSQEESIVVNGAGKWWLVVTNIYGCSAADTARVVLLEASNVSHLLNVTTNETITYGSSIQLNADNENSYYWKPNDGSLENPNINNPIATPLHTTTYTVYGYDIHGCLDSASVIIYVDSTTSECIPTAFTPNGDGLNDEFGPTCNKFQRLVEFSITNRWGQRVYYSNDFKKKWDGTFNGVKQDVGVYFYLITVARPGGGLIYYKGDVTLIR